MRNFQIILNFVTLIEIENFFFCAEHFLYDRSQEHQMSAYIQSDIPEEDELNSEVIHFS